MSPEVEVVERPREDRVQHKRSKSESHQGLETPQPSEWVLHDHHRRSREPKEKPSLTEGEVPGDRSCQHIHDKIAHSELTNTQPELYSNSADVIETISTENETETSSTLSGDELLNSKAHLEQLRNAEATSKQELQLEREAHSETKAKLQSIITALESTEKNFVEKMRKHSISTKLCKDAQQRSRETHEQQLQELRVQHEDRYQSVVLSKDEEVRALKIELESVSEKNEESLKASRREVDDANQQRDDAISIQKALLSQLAAARKQKEDYVLMMQEKSDTKDRELDDAQDQLEATRDKLAANQSKSDSIIAKLREEMKTANEDHQTSKALHEAQKTLNKTLENKNKLLEKRSSEAKEKLKNLQAVHKSEQSQLKNQIVELNAGNKAIKIEKEKLQAEFDSHIAQHHEDINDLLQQVRESQGLSQRYNFRVSDEEIIDEWQNLRHKVRQFVDKYTRPIQVPKTQLSERWTVLSPFISKLLTSPLSSAFAFEAYLWEWMTLNVLDPFSLAWAGELGRNFTGLSWKIEDQIRRPDLHEDLTSEYHCWRATSSNLLSRVSPRESHQLSQHGSLVVLMSDLDALLGSTFTRDNVDRDLADIVDTAQAFDIMRRKVKSKVEICFGACDEAGGTQRYDMPVDDSLMRVRTADLEADLVESYPDQGPIVKLVVSPAIVRWGNSSGVDYDRKTCLVKMDVLVSPLPEHISQPPAERAPVPSCGQLVQRGNIADERRHSGQNSNASGKHIEDASPCTFADQTTRYAQPPKMKEEQHTETGHSLLTPSSGDSVRQDHSFPMTRSISRTFRPRNTVEYGTRKRRASEIEQKNQIDELTGGPGGSNYSRDSKPTTSKKRKSGGSGNGGR